MKYFVCGVVVVFCGLAYLRSAQPRMWNDGLAALKAPEDATPVASEPTVAATVAPAPVTPAPVVPPPLAQPPEQPTQPKADSVANLPKEFVPPDPIPAQANWTWTVFGKIYNNVVVTKVEADRVHIVYDGGIGSINQADLPPDLQKMFNYDPELAAKAATQTRKAQTAAEELAIQEAQQAAIIQQREQPQANASQSVPGPSALTSSTPNLSQEQREGVQSRIDSLQADISFMQKEEAKVYEDGNKQVVKADNNVTSQGAYTQKIIDEQAEVTQLQKELR